MLDLVDRTDVELREERVKGGETETETEALSFIDESYMDESWTRSWQTNRLVLMVKEPTSLFAYWEVNDLRKQLISEHFRCDWDQLRFCLRVYDVTQIQFNGYNAHSTRSLQVDSSADNYYILHLQSGRRYLVDYGTTTYAGSFFAILRSNIVEMPRQPAHAQPKIRFGPIHKTHLEQQQPAKKLPSLVVHATVEQTPAKEAVWKGYFDGYRLVEVERGDK